MAVQIDRLLVILIPTKVAVQRDKVQKYRFDRSDILKKRFESTHSLFFLDCRGRGGYVIIVQVNELERWKVYPLLKGGVFLRIVVVIAPPIITRGGSLDLDRKFRGSSKFLPSLKWAPDTTKSQNSSSPR